MSDNEDRSQRHKRAMQRKKAHVDQRIAQATMDKNLLIVLTGDGKGKSSSAFGMLARSVGHGLKCAVVQFIKGQWKCGEQENFANHPLVDFHVMKTGFTWETQDRVRDQELVKEAWQIAKRFITDESTEAEAITAICVGRAWDLAGETGGIANHPPNEWIACAVLAITYEVLRVVAAVSAGITHDPRAGVASR